MPLNGFSVHFVMKYFSSRSPEVIWFHIFRSASRLHKRMTTNKFTFSDAVDVLLQHAASFRSRGSSWLGASHSVCCFHRWSQSTWPRSTCCSATCASPRSRRLSGRCLCSTWPWPRFIHWQMSRFIRPPMLVHCRLVAVTGTGLQTVKSKSVFLRLDRFHF